MISRIIELANGLDAAIARQKTLKEHGKLVAAHKRDIAKYGEDEALERDYRRKVRKYGEAKAKRLM